MQYSYFLPILYLIALPTQADISLSSMANEPLPMDNGEYAISQELGKTAGNNVFHSFHRFNLNQGETATFSGAANIDNVIARVTGGSPSTIDGTIKNTIPGADTWLMNPAGIVFGEHAGLDVHGSFHASTAEHLEFSDGKFYADIAKSSTFSSAPPEAFGFLGDASIRVSHADLSVAEGKTLALSAGHIRLHSDSPLQLDKTGTDPVDAATRLAAPGGELRLQTPNDGAIEIERSLLDSSGAGGGLIDISGGKLDMRESLLRADALEPGREGMAAGIKLTLKEAIFIRNLDVWRSISLNGYGASYQGSLEIDTPFLHLEEALFSAAQYTAGDNAVFDIRVNRLLMENGAMIAKDAFHPDSQGTELRVHADELAFKGIFQGERVSNGIGLLDYPCAISNAAYRGQGGDTFIQAGKVDLDAGYIASTSEGDGDAGNVWIEADALHLKNAAFVDTVSQGGGKAGRIVLHIKDKLILEKLNPLPFFTPYPQGQPEKMEVYAKGRTAIQSFAYPGSDGGGSVNIEAGTVEMRDDAFIKATTYGVTTPGNQGIITVHAQQISLESGAQIKNDNFQDAGRVLIGTGNSGDVNVTAAQIDISGSGGNGPSGFTTDTYSGGLGGNMRIHSEALTVRDGGAISAHSHADGNAGSVYIHSRDLTLKNGGLIDTEAQGAGGGSVELDSSGLVVIDHAAISTSVLGGAGGGGDLSISNPAALVLLNNAKITAQAYEGQGGNIQIYTDNLLQRPGSLISASSQLGIDGDLSIQAQQTFDQDGLFKQSTDFLDTKLPVCEVHDSLSRFAIKITPQRSLPFGLN